MSSQSQNVHEPDEELLSAEDAVQDAKLLQSLFNKQGESRNSVSLQIPLSVLLDALDNLEPEALRKVARRAEELLAST